MKKLLLFILFIIGIFGYVNAENIIINSIDTIYQDGKSVVTTLYSDAKYALNEVYPDIKNVIIEIGKAIGIASEHVYGVLVKKYFVLGVKNLCTFITGIILFIIGYYNWNKVTNNGPVTYKVIVPGLFITFALIMICSVKYDEMFMGLINPEYGAINYILEYTKTISK